MSGTRHSTSRPRETDTSLRPKQGIINTLELDNEYNKTGVKKYNFIYCHTIYIDLGHLNRLYIDLGYLTRVYITLGCTKIPLNLVT